MTKPVSAMRISYDLGQLGDQNILADPIAQFDTWFQEVRETDVHEANAMTVCTADAEGNPDARTLLMKGFDDRGIVMYTNYESKKARDLEANPNVCLLFYWPSLQRQVRWTGVAERVSAEESDDYFASRPRGSQIGSNSSPQSQVIPGQTWLAERFAEMEAEYADGQDVPRPEHWGGYRVRPQAIEFWQGRQNRLHDRIRYRLVDGAWTVERLAP